MLYSISKRYGLYSAINLRIEIRSFSFPRNLPPSEIGRRVQTHRLRCLLINSSASGTCTGFKKSNRISAYSDFLRAFVRTELSFFGVFSAIETQVL